jgi:hypothetical protein
MKRPDMRRRIAHATARLLAEDGSLDYGSAKRKAARQLGAPTSQNLPDNQEIEDALRDYQALYRADETLERTALLKAIALEYMHKLAPYDPHLTGSVLNGTAGKYSDVNLQLFTDDGKELEFLLMSFPHPYRSGGHPHHDPASPHLPRFIIDDPRAAIDIVVHPANDLRKLKRFQADGSPRRLRLRALLDDGPQVPDIGTLTAKPR